MMKRCGKFQQRIAATFLEMKPELPGGDWASMVCAVGYDFGSARIGHFFVLCGVTIDWLKQEQIKRDDTDLHMEEIIELEFYITETNPQNTLLQHYYKLGHEDGVDIDLYWERWQQCCHELSK